jgi:cobalt-zinc-cadmium efflux system membrane fusion protein
VNVRVLALALAVLGGAACSKNKPPAPREEKAEGRHDSHADEPEHEGVAKRVRIGPNVMKDAKIAIAPVTKEVLAVTVVLTGEVTSDPDKTARVSAPIAGRLERVAFKEGSVVKKGDLLAVVKVPELGKIRSAHSATSAKAAAARANADRLSTLAEKRLAAEQEVVSARAEAAALEADARALSEQLQAVGTGETGGGPELGLRAPIGGVVVSRDAVIGQPVTAEQIIATITDLSEIWFLGRVFEKDLGRVKTGANTEIALNAYPREHFTGQVEYIGRQIDPIARTVTARIRLQNRDDLLRIGLFGTARVATGEMGGRPAQIVIPRTAVVDISDKPVVFIRQPDGDFELHDIVLGESALGKVEVLNGLREGEQVVTEGAFTLKSIALKSTLAEDE